MQALPSAQSFLPLHPSYPPLLLPEPSEAPAPLASGAFLLTSPSMPAGGGGGGARFGTAAPGSTPAAPTLGTLGVTYDTAAMQDQAAQRSSSHAGAFPAAEANGSLGYAQG